MPAHQPKFGPVSPQPSDSWTVTVRCNTSSSHICMRGPPHLVDPFVSLGTHCRDAVLVGRPHRRSSPSAAALNVGQCSCRLSPPSPPPMRQWHPAVAALCTDRCPMVVAPYDDDGSSGALAATAAYGCALHHNSLLVHSHPP